MADRQSDLVPWIIHEERFRHDGDEEDSDDTKIKISKNEVLEKTDKVTKHLSDLQNALQKS